MMGNAQWDYRSVVCKNTSAILAFTEKSTYTVAQDAPCIHCGRCVSVCPMHLMPNYLAAFSKAKNDEMCEKFNIMSCVECGCCTYNCPAGVPIVQHIRNTKTRVVAVKKKLSEQKQTKA